MVEPGRARVHRRPNSARFIRARADLQPAHIRRRRRTQGPRGGIQSPHRCPALRLRSHPGRAGTGATFVAFDLPTLASRDLRGLPQCKRRLRRLLAAASPPLALMPATARLPAPSVDARVRGRWRRAGGGQTPRARVRMRPRPIRCTRPLQQRSRLRTPLPRDPPRTTDVEELHRDRPGPSPMLRRSHAATPATSSDPGTPPVDVRP